MFSFINLSVTRPQALKIAKNYLKSELAVDPAQYRHAMAFNGARGSDRYLQRTIGFEKELEFFKEHEFELFSWGIRFFQENEKEQYFVSVSASTGEVLSFVHTVKDSDTRPDQTEKQAKQKAIKFLEEKFNFKKENYIQKANLSKKFDNRTDYSFVWEKKSVFIRWSDKPETGGAKLLIGIKISGNEAMAFYKNSLEIPEEFNRSLSRKSNIGKNFSVLFRILFFSLLTASIFFVIVRRHNLVLHTIKRFGIAITAFMFFVYLINYVNEFEGVLAGYPSTSSFVSYLWRNISNLIVDTFIVTISFLMPFLAGESLHYEESQDKKRGSFLHYINSTFFSRNVFQLILIGYFATIILIGTQSLLFEIGQKYLGVWVEYTWMAQLTASYLPFLTAFIIGIIASFSEEITFRLFSINFGKKIFKSTFIAVLISCVLWGYGHSNPNVV